MNESENDFEGARDALLNACSDAELKMVGLLDSRGRLAEEVRDLLEVLGRLRSGLAMAGALKPRLRTVGVIGRLLGGTAEAAARVEAWQALGLGESEEGGIENVLAEMLKLQADIAVRRPPESLVEWSVAAISTIRWEQSQLDSELLAEACRRGGERMTRRLEKRLKRAIEKAEDDDFEVLRKALDTWHGGFRLLAPGITPPAEQSLLELMAHLNGERELARVRNWLRDRRVSPATAPQVWKQIGKLQAALRRKSLRLIRRQILPEMKECRKARRGK